MPVYRLTACTLVFVCLALSSVPGLAATSTEIATTHCTRIEPGLTPEFMALVDDLSGSEGDLDCGAAICYLDADTGKLVSVLALDDSAYPSAASARSAVTHSTGGDGLVVEGVFSAVFDAQGHNLAPGGASRVVLDDGGPRVVQ